MITKIYEFYKMLTEKAFNIDDTNNCIVIRHISSNEVKICLYNYIDKSILGYITAGRDKRTPEYFLVDRSSADKGWGPFMYTLMLQSLYPKGIKPSAIIRPSAINVYKHFISNPNIKTNLVPTTDPNFADEWRPDVDVMPREAPEETKIINTVFKQQPEAWFVPFIEESNTIIKEQNINTSEVFKKCLTYFMIKYDNSRVPVYETITIPNKDTTGKYLLVNETGNNIEFLIQDKSAIFGYAELTKKSTYYQVVNVAAEPGFGPFLYDTIMSYLDKPVRPCRSLTKEAWNVWNKYCNQRPDVTKKEVSTNTWDNVDLDHRYVTTSTAVEPLNYLYTIKDDKRKTEAIDWQYDSYNNFVQPMKEKLPEFMKIRFNQAKLWFNKQYPM